MRQAFALAIDREALAGDALRGRHSPATGGLVPPGVPGHSPGIGLPYDPEQARRLLAEAGYSSGHGFPRLDPMPVNGGDFIAMAKHIGAQLLENLGVEIAWEIQSVSEAIATLASQKPQMWFMGWDADYPDPDSFLRVAAWPEGTGWSNETYDALVADARRSTDQAERIGMYQAAERIMIQEVPVIPLSYLRDNMLFKPWVKRQQVPGFGSVSWKDIIIEPH